jgi:transcriptional regulator with XRE-family HTH domain
MRLLSVDGLRRTLNNGDVDKAQLAENVRTGRAKLNLTRVQFARRAKITTNTLRTLESGTHSRLPDTETLQKVAKALKTTTEALFSGKNIQPDDALLAGLNREDLEIARLYHDSTTTVRQRVYGLLHDGEPERVTTLVKRLQRFSAEDFAVIETAITTIDAAHQNVREKKASQS